MNKPQFGIRSLIVLTTLAALSIVAAQFLAEYRDESTVFSIILSSVSAIVGLTMCGTALLFAFAIAVTEDCPNTKSSNLHQCLHMFCFGLVGVLPLGALILVALAV